MNVGALERPATSSPLPAPTGGGVAARQAMIRWAWRLFKREWRQQLMILLLVIVAMAAVVVGSAVAVNTPPPANSGFGTAGDLAVFNLAPAGSTTGAQTPAHVAAQIARLQHTFATVQVIENRTENIPGSTSTYQLRVMDPHGPYGGPMLQLLSGHYPSGPNEVAITPGLASELDLRIGDSWPQGSKTVVGIVQNPQSLLDEFALVPFGQLSNPTQIGVLFDAPGVDPASIGPNVSTPSDNGVSNPINPETIVLAVATVGMLLIALVSIGGFTVLAQRRMRALGMLESLGATDRNVRLVVRANGVIVGLVGTLVGFAVGLAVWFLYRPRNEQEAHHLIGMWALPWTVIVISMVLAVLATLFAADRPARAITRVPVVAALAGRPAPPRQIHRSLIPGLIALVIGFLFFGATGTTNHSSGSIDFVIPGLICLIVGIILISPFFLALLAHVGRRLPIAIRLPLRDLSRYRARSGSALSAISVGALIAVVICAVAVARYANVFDYVGPNMAANELNVYTPPTGPTFGPGGETQPTTPASSLATQQAAVHAIAFAVGATTVAELEQPAVGLQNPSGNGRQWNGPIYVATPSLLRAFDINPSSIPSNVDILSARPGLAGSGVQLTYGGGGGKGAVPGPGGPGPDGPDGGSGPNSCPAGSCLAHPVVQEESRLPTGTSAPNTLITERTLSRLGLETQNSLDGWLLRANSPITSAQITNAQALAAGAGLTIESKNDAPTSSTIVDWATVSGIALALGILAMSVGLLRSETARDLRTLTAAGASSRTRRALTAVTAGTLAFLGALLGTLAAYVGLLGYFRGNALEGGISDLTSHIPWVNLFLIVIAMPLAAVAIGWLLAGREPTGIATRPIE